MKIISLTMNAFLAYKETTTINFEEMIDHGLYLISGPTGAGKTTIFDAITFALYGEASGSERNQSYFRSDFAENQEETYVELTFELHQHIYTVKRSPTYTRVGYKTAKMANAYLTEDVQTIEGVKEVNAKINQLLGVDVKQFKQIVMIAQGEFTKLIYASSEERECVLRHIFHSESLVDFENLLREETKKYKDQYFLSNQQLLSRYQLLSLPEEFMLLHKESFHPSYIEDALIENKKFEERLKISSHDYESSKKQFDELSQAFYKKQKQNQDILEYQNINKQYDALLLKKEDIKQLKTNIDKLKLLEQNQSLIDQYRNTHNLLMKTTQDYQSFEEKSIQKKFIVIEKEYEGLPQLNLQKEKELLEIERIKQNIEKQIKYQEVKTKENQLQKYFQKTQQDYQLITEKYNHLTKRMERDYENVEHLPELLLELQKSEQTVQEVNQRRISIHELSDLYDSYTHVQDGHYDMSEKYKKASQDYLEILEKYQHADENFKVQQAGILASTLQDNHPCPVCGSLDHPHLANISHDVLTSVELEELSQEVDKYRVKKEDVYQQVYLQNQNVESIKTQIGVLKKQLMIEEELSKEVFIRLLADMTHITKDQEKSYQKKHTEVEYLRKIKKSLEQDELHLSEMKKECDVFQNKLHQNEVELASYQTQLQQLQIDECLELEDFNQLLNHKKQLSADLNKRIETITNQYHQMQQDLKVTQNQIDILKQREDEYNNIMNQLQNKYETFIQKYFNTEDNFLLYEKKLSELPLQEKEYQDYMIQEATLASRLSELKKIVKGQEIIDLAQEQEKLNSLEMKRDEAFQTMNNDSHIYQQNLTLIEMLKKEYNKNQDIFENYTMYQDLSDMTSGKNPQRLSFERYVLSSYFEHILEYANVELLKMSNGRYALYRKQETKGAKQQGLELSVLDYETGVMRDIQSLSGGESFKAALSLALGLSSMIQSYAGGIELNTLFIDEGFGSLDSESIDQALSVLLDMKNDNKVIGIISHVSELKERITTQIVVEKTKQGSYLHIEKE